MKKEELFDIIGEVSDEKVRDAARPRKKRRWIAWCAAAACLCIVAGGVLYKADHPWPVKMQPVQVTQSSGEIAIIPRWEEMEIYQQYFSIELGEILYSVHGAEVPEDRLGETLGAVTARGWDEYAAMDGKDGERTIKAELRAIKDIESRCAAAVCYTGTDTWYPCVNSYYRPETLGQFVSDLNLKENVSFGTVYYDAKRPISGERITVCFDDLPQEAVWKMLDASSQAINEYDDVKTMQNYPKNILSISVDIPLLGYENISLSVHEGGYIITNILDTGKQFDLGEENTKAFVSYVLENCTGYEYVPIYTNAEPVPE